MSNCIFCSFSKDKKLIPDQFLSEDRDSFVMLSLNPQTEGHLLVIPKRHFSKLSEMEDLAGLLFNKAITQGEILKKNLKAKAFVIKVNNELYKLESGKGHVGHIHIHVIPRYKAGEVLADIPEKAPVTVLKSVQGRLLGSDRIKP